MRHRRVRADAPGDQTARATWSKFEVQRMAGLPRTQAGNRRSAGPAGTGSARREPARSTHQRGRRGRGQAKHSTDHDLRRIAPCRPRGSCAPARPGRRMLVRPKHVAAASPRSGRSRHRRSRVATSGGICSLDARRRYVSGTDAASGRNGSDDELLQRLGSKQLAGLIHSLSQPLRV